MSSPQSVVQKSRLVIPPVSRRCAAGCLLFPAVDLGLRGPKAAWALPALPRGLPALAQGQQPNHSCRPGPIQKLST